MLSRPSDLEAQPLGRGLCFQLVDHTPDAAVHSRDRHIVLLAHRLQDLLADGQLLAGAVHHAHRTGKIVAVHVRQLDAPALIQFLTLAFHALALPSRQAVQLPQQVLQFGMAHIAESIARFQTNGTRILPPALIKQNNIRFGIHAADIH